MGTVSTGTGIIPALTVGKSSVSTSGVGAVSSQANLTGTWSLDLKGTLTRHIDLQMTSKGDFIMGSGSISLDKSTAPVTAAGSVRGDSPSLFVCRADGKEAIRLTLSTSGTSLAGEYDSLSSNVSTASGTVTGSMSLSAGNTSPVSLGSSPTTTATGAWVGSSIAALEEQD